jgi:4'-phosphopantetheinyl transferase
MSMSEQVTSVKAVEVDVWNWSLDQHSVGDNDDERLISKDEIERATRFLRPVDRRRYIAGRAGLRRILASYLKRDPVTLSFIYNACGKPALAHDEAAGLHFNLSHTAGQALLGVCAHASIGVDIEEIRPLREDVASHFFSAKECADLNALPESDRLEAFYRCWTRKEAFVKAQGAGLSLPLDSFDVSLELGDDTCLLRRLDPQIGPLDDWTVRNLDAGAGFCAALAVHSKGRGVTVRYRNRCDWSLNMASMM